MRITLPSNQEAWVEADPSLVVIGDIGSPVTMLAKSIREWNLADENGTLDISEATVGMLPLSDCEHVLSSMGLRPDREMIRKLIVALDAPEGSTLDVPMEYSLFLYRKQMGVTHEELARMPLAVFNQDLEFISIEAQIRRKNAQD